mgnify:CR=1 FL=1
MIQEILKRLNKIEKRLRCLSCSTNTGVQSITGNGVDNTDPKNPIISKEYKVYSVLISQSGTNAPVFNILKNDFNINFTIGRTTDGSYYLTGPQQTFLYNKTQVFIGSSIDISDYVIAFQNNTSTIVFKSYRNGSLSDNIFNSSYKISLEIRVYP